MNLKTKLGLVALAMLALAAMSPTVSATDVVSTEPLPLADEEQARYAPKPPIEAEACVAVIPPLCGDGNDAARVAYDVLGITRCIAVLAGGTVYNC